MMAQIYLVTWCGLSSTMEAVCGWLILSLAVTLACMGPNFFAFSLTCKRDVREAALWRWTSPCRRSSRILLFSGLMRRAFTSSPFVCLRLHLPKESSAVRRATVLQMMRRWDHESESSSSVSNSDVSSEDGSSEKSDLDKFEEVFDEFGKLSCGLDDIDSE